MAARRQLTRMNGRSEGKLHIPHGTARQWLAAPTAGVPTKVRRGEYLFHAGDRTAPHFFTILYGSFKCGRINTKGQEQIFAFQLREDCLALDTFGTMHHGYSAIALEDSAVSAIRFCDMRADLVLFQRVISQQVARGQDLAQLRRHNSAETKLATFFLDLSWRHHARGYSSSRFRLSMERRDIANYLALSPACISRTMRSLEQNGLIQAREREITLLDIPRLRQLAGDRIDAVTAGAGNP